MPLVRRSAVYSVLLMFLALASHLGAQNISYSYDDLGRLVGVVDQNGNAAQYVYDANGNIISVKRYSSSAVAILNFSPQRDAVGNTVTLSGINFGTSPSQNTVSFNGTQAQVVSASSSQIVVTVPVNATTGPISVSAPTGTATSTQSFTVDATKTTPTISSFTPVIALAGSSVTLTGVGFGSPSSSDMVQIASHAVPVQSGSTPTSVSFIVPANAGSSPITLNAPEGLATSSTDLFIPPSPYTVAQVAVAQRIQSATPTVTHISAPKKIDMFTFSGLGGERVNLAVYNMNFSGCQDLSILDTTNATLVDGGNVCGTGGGSVPDVLLPKTGTYTALVTPLQGGPGTGSIAVSDDIYGALSLNTTLQTTLSLPGQSGRFTFSGTIGEEVNLALTNMTFPNCITYSIFNPDGSELENNGTCGTENGFSEVVLPATGIYAVIVSPGPPNGGGASSGSAGVTLSTDQKGTLTMSTGVPITFTVPGQNDQLSFTGSANQIINLALTNTNLPNCVTYSIFGPDGSQLQENDTCGTENGLSEVTLPSNGTYIALVSPDSGGTGSTTATLSTDQTGSLSMSSSDSINLTTPGQNARLTFSGTAKQLINLELTNITFPNCVDYSILTSSGSQVASGSTCDVAGGLPEVSLPSTGTYSALISPEQGGTGTATVTLSSDQTGSLSTSSTFGVSLTYPGQNARLTFSGTSGQKATVSLTAVNFPSCVTYSILNPNGSQLSTGSTCGTSGSLKKIALSKTGTYTVLISPGEGGTGSGTVALSFN